MPGGRVEEEKKTSYFQKRKKKILLSEEEKKYLFVNVLCFPCFILLLVVEGAGRGAIATKDLKVGDIALEIPVSIIIFEELVHKSDMVCFIIYKHL